MLSDQSSFYAIALRPMQVGNGEPFDRTYDYCHAAVNPLGIISWQKGEETGMGRI
jgi:hypothetical protein